MGIFIKDTWVLCLSESPHLPPPLIFPVSVLAVPSPSAAMPLWRCFTLLYGSTPISPCCPRLCSTSSALRPRSSLACCPVLCPSSLSSPWRRSERHWLLAIMGRNFVERSTICSLMQEKWTIILSLYAQVLVVDLGNSRLLRQVGHALSRVCVRFLFHPYIEENWFSILFCHI